MKRATKAYVFPSVIENIGLGKKSQKRENKKKTNNSNII